MAELDLIWFASNSNLFSRLILLFISQSHKIITSHPAASSFTLFILSRFIFDIILSLQKSVLVSGSFDPRAQEWPCQKQPCIKTIFLYLGKTISGFPGNSGSFFLNLNPWENRYFLTSTSGCVSFPLIADIILLLLSLLKISVIGRLPRIC